MFDRVTPAAVLVLCLLASGCGTDRGARDAVGAYIEQVNLTEQKLAQPLLEVSKANRDFASRKAKADPVEIERRLTRSEQQIRKLRERLAAVAAPAEARRLRTLMLELIAREADLTREVAQLVAFIPAFSEALRPVGPAGPALKEALAGSAPVTAKADALDRYRAVLATVIERLAPLRPPPASLPVYASQVSTLREVSAAVAGLADALRRKRRVEIARFLHRFDLAAVANQSLAAQRAQIAAVTAYNARIRSIDRITVRIARERSRLEKRLS